MDDLQDRIELHGGTVLNCCGAGCVASIYVCLLPCCAFGQASANSGVGLNPACEALLGFVPCWMPMRIAQVNSQMGGPMDFCQRCLWWSFCPCLVPCFLCQFYAAVKEAGAKGKLRVGGAPEQLDMEH